MPAKNSQKVLHLAAAGTLAFGTTDGMRPITSLLPRTSNPQRTARYHHTTETEPPPISAGGTARFHAPSPRQRLLRPHHRQGRPARRCRQKRSVGPNVIRNALIPGVAYPRKSGL